MYYMLPDEVHKSNPAAIPTEMKVHGLDSYCRLEGMDYQQLATEASSKRSFIKRRFSRIEPAQNNKN